MAFAFPAAEVADDEGMFMAVRDAALDGYAALDCGATSSIGGLTAVQALADFGERSLGRTTAVDPRVQKTFRFGNGSSQTCLSKATLPLAIGKQTGTVDMNVLDAPAPALLGMDFLTKSGAVVDFSANTVTFKKISPEKHRLKKLESGHVALRLTGSAAAPR